MAAASAQGPLPHHPRGRLICALLAAPALLLPVVAPAPGGRGPISAAREWVQVARRLRGEPLLERPPTRAPVGEDVGAPPDGGDGREVPEGGTPEGEVHQVGNREDAAGGDGPEKLAAEGEPWGGQEELGKHEAAKHEVYGEVPDVLPGRFISSKGFRDFEWSEPKYTVEEALTAAPGWSDLSFIGGTGTITQKGLAAWIEDDLLNERAFADHDGKVPVPWPESGGDQLGQGHWVGYSRRQLCYIVAKSLVGATTVGYANGLARFMAGCPRKGEFGQAMVTLLASCAADPTLADGAPGPLLLVARAKAPPEVSQARGVAANTSMSAAHLRICQYSDGAGPLPGVDRVPASGCRRPTGAGVGVDFMTGGLRAAKAQATQDISASWLGGYIFGNACGLGGGQDERLMVYYPEVTALAFFLSEGSPFPQLRQPAWVLGARKLFTGLDGSARFDEPLRVESQVYGDLKIVEVEGQRYPMSSSTPFLAFMSENQGYFGPEDREKLGLARRNKHPMQRLSGQERHAFEKQVRAWYGAVALTSYDERVQPALKQLVGSIGTGPWLAGLWWGDSQLGMLAVWIGQALAAPTWSASGPGGGERALPVDYYIYSDFTENPGNQCFVHSRDNCIACLRACAGHPLPESAYWMPEYAFYESGSCAESTADCGVHGVEDVVAAYRSRGAGTLWSDVEAAVRGKGTERTVFDLLLEKRPPAAGTRP